MRAIPELPHPLPSGLIAVVGDEGTGKTRLLRHLAAEGHQPEVLMAWLDLSLPGRDQETPSRLWDSLRAACPGWDDDAQAHLIEALGLQPHLEKHLFMLSRGSRRKVALAGLLAAGTRVTCLDQPYAALDLASMNALRQFLQGKETRTDRTWFVADYEADPALPWRQVIRLD